MVSVLDRKLLRELRQLRGLLLAITSIMAVGVMCFVYMRSAYHNLRPRQAAVLRPVPDGRFLDRREEGPAGRAGRAWPNCRASSRSARGSSSSPRSIWSSVAEPLNGLVLSLPDRRQPIINDIVLKRGGYFTDRARQRSDRQRRLRPAARAATRASGST